MLFIDIFYYLQLEEDLSKIDLKDELNCPVCRELCKVPPRECLLCGHLFCYECIANLKSCPLCRNEPFDYRESCFASRLLNNIHVKCGSCDSMVIRSQLETHMAAMCEARLRQCSFPECTFAANNVLELTDHIKNQHQSRVVKNCDKYVDSALPLVANFIHCT